MEPGGTAAKDSGEPLEDDAPIDEDLWWETNQED